MLSSRAIRYYWRDGGPVITAGIVVVCVALWLVELLLALLVPSALNIVVAYGAFSPMFVVSHPWTLITSMFLHQPTSILHILFNMLTLWALGPMLERMMGHWPFLALYLISGLGGDAGMMVWAVVSPQGAGWFGSAYGASGALFGLFAAELVVSRRVGMDMRPMLVWLVINCLMPVVMPNIAWQAHVGGFVVGAAFTGLLVSGVHALRGKSLAYRSVVYGVTVVVVLAVVMTVCWMNNPLRDLALLGL